MVYRGRPSTGCTKCRQRKIKCDERPNGCVKCSDKGYTCPGYDRTLDRYFHDESSHVKEKAQKSQAKAIALRDERERKAKSQTSPTKIQDSIETPLLCPLVDQGINFFMMHYALGIEQPTVQSDAYHRHISTYGFHPIIVASMVALGLSGISNIFQDTNFWREAMRWYLKALHMTNAALASPTEVKSDNTLLATMLLGVFEHTSNEKSFAAWSSHVEGSASLIRIRGTRQFSTPTGRRMYLQTVGLLTMNCMGKREPLPDFVHMMNKEIKEHQNMSDPGNRFYYLHIDTIDFRAQVLHGKITDLQAIMDRALEIDEIAKTVFEDVGPEWEFEEVHTEDNIPGVFGKYFHIYSHPGAAHVWNWVRFNRIYLHDIIRNCLIAGFSRTPPAFVGARYMRLLEESTQTLYRMQSNILASIPQHMRDTPDTLSSCTPMSSPSPPSTFSASSPGSVSLSGQSKFFLSNFQKLEFRSDWIIPLEVKERLPVIRVAGGYAFLWALYMAGATPIATPGSQEYVLKTFNRLINDSGINQSKVLSNALRLKIQLDRTGRQSFDIVPMYLPAKGKHMEA